MDEHGATKVSTRRTVVHDLQENERIVITVPRGLIDSEEIALTLEHKSGRRARLRVTASDDTVIARPAAATRRPT